MSISWGTKIAALYIGFVVMIVSLVAAASLRKTDLVAEDYYKQEVEYQQRLNATNLGNKLSSPISLIAKEQILTLHFPREFDQKLLTGSIHFYAPSGSKADRTYALRTLDGTFKIPGNELAKCPYEVQVSWAAEGKTYFQTLMLTL